MIYVLLAGTLYAAPVRRTAKNGNPFATAKLLADADDGSTVWCNVIAFGEAGERLATLEAGDAVSMTGKARLNQWEDQNGNLRAGLSVTATEIVALRREPRARFRKPRALRSQPEPASDEAAPFDDDLDFLDAEPAEVEADSSSANAGGNAPAGS